MVETVNHPHGNHNVTHGTGKQWVKDPNTTSLHDHAGTIPGGTEGGKQHVKVGKGTV